MPYLMHIARALLVALVGALATVAINRFDKYNREKNEDTFQRPLGKMISTMTAGGKT